ncbi:hypothetical protein NG697_12550 [Pseudarthrobacter sp. MDT3-26]|uniref:hypothetical protein n=1 Tax=Pseudarthrobacter raffinosi TaxID=2953651 RepID=UPI00208DDEF2|nr:hypothetical protein [Pseudarthrobacter sp. MDT3-26]MCO4263742.1 hypothetical protein [Pseudarthrobacter sp. MDT3-26]
MEGWHEAQHASGGPEAAVLLHDVCGCGRRNPRTMSASDLARDTSGDREVQRAAARLRLVTDRRLERLPTPQWVIDLAHEDTDPLLEPGWMEKAIARLDREARKRCPCRCHGHKTPNELARDERDERNLVRARAISEDSR